MICARHDAIASHLEYGLPMCSRCFREAVTHAEEAALDMTIRTFRADNTPAITQTSAAWLVAQLGWSE